MPTPKSTHDFKTYNRSTSFNAPINVNPVGGGGGGGGSAGKGWGFDKF